MLSVERWTLSVECCQGGHPKTLTRGRACFTPDNVQRPTLNAQRSTFNGQPLRGRGARSGGLASAEPAFGLGLALLDFELAEQGLEADEEAVPVIFHVAESVFVHLAEVTDGRGGSDQAVDIFAADGTAIDGGKDEFEFLGDDAFDFEELVFILLGELFGSAHDHEGIELFPTLQIVLEADDELLDGAFAHREERLKVGRLFSRGDSGADAIAA